MIHALFALIVLTILAAAWFVPSWFVAKYAARKGYSFAGFFLIGIFISWILSLIIALILSDKNKPMPINSQNNVDYLVRLGELHEKGILSQEEFDAKKALLMSSEQPKS